MMEDIFVNLLIEACDIVHQLYFAKCFTKKSKNGLNPKSTLKFLLKPLDDQ